MAKNKKENIVVENIDKLENLTVKQLGENVTLFNRDKTEKNKDYSVIEQKNIDDIDLVNKQIQELNNTEKDILKNKQKDIKDKDNVQNPENNLNEGKKNFFNFKKIKEITKSNLVKIFNNNKKYNSFNYNIENTENKKINTNNNITENNNVLSKEEILGISKTVLNDKKVMMFSTIGIAITKLIKYLSNVKESSNNGSLVKNIIDKIPKKEVIGYLTKKGGLLEGISKTSWGTGKLSKVIKGASAVTAAYEVTKDAIGGYKNSENWLGKEKGNTVQGKVSSTLGGAIGGTGSGLSGALANAGKGAAIGSLIAGPIGTAVGGLIGAGLGAIGGKRISKFFNGFIDITKKNWKVALGIVAPVTAPVLIASSLFKKLKNNWPFSKNNNPKDKADEEKRIEEEKKNNKDNIDKSKDKVLKEKDNTKAREENTKGLLEKLGDKIKGFVDDITKSVTSTMGKAKEFVSGLGSDIKDGISGIFNRNKGKIYSNAKRGTSIAEDCSSYNSQTGKYMADKLGFTEGSNFMSRKPTADAQLKFFRKHNAITQTLGKGSSLDDVKNFVKNLKAGQTIGLTDLHDRGQNGTVGHVMTVNKENGMVASDFSGYYNGLKGWSEDELVRYLYKNIQKGRFSKVEAGDMELASVNGDTTKIINNQNNKQQVANIPKTVATNKAKKEQITDEKREQKLKQKEKNLNEDYSLYAKTTKEMNEKNNKKIVNKIVEVSETIASNNSSTTTIINNTNDPLTNIKNEVYGVLI